MPSRKRVASRRHRSATSVSCSSGSSSTRAMSRCSSSPARPGRPWRGGRAPRGHAIEVRLYAEDVDAGFLPSTGQLLHFRVPDGIRVDAGYDEGCEITRHYDPLLAKLIAHGPHRKLALAKLDEALAQTEALGVRTNLPFLRGLVAHPDVQRGRVDTELVSREFGHLLPAG